ncbi:MAG: RIP metalloprotease RseP [Patescibacteria group bacterium]|jgi:regulator of sigma E protease|nr:RIP metalloprotease RseP [Candidatus Magasanikbacteria bacterium]
MTIIIFIIILGIIVLAHEFGHFITARKSGMKVYEFGIGFPPRAIGVYRDPKTKKFVWVFGKGKTKLKQAVAGEEIEEQEFPATLYSLNWLPIGGFCKIKGENGEKAVEPDSFGYQKAWKKVIVLSAGVIMNVILAGIVLGIGFIIGLPTDMSQGVDKRAIVITPAEVMIQSVEKNTPAETAGIQYGDVVISINDEFIVNTAQMQEIIKNNGDKEIKLVVRRNGEELSLQITPSLIKEETTPRLGVMLADAGVIRYPWYIALAKGFIAAGIVFVNIMITFYILIKGLIVGQGLMFELAGPVGIATIVGQGAKLGINYLLNITAMISLSLAVINILPFPALDGGRILFILIGGIIRRPVPLKYEQIAHTLGFLLLMVLFIFITARDVINLF